MPIGCRIINSNYAAFHRLGKLAASTIFHFMCDHHGIIKCRAFNNLNNTALKRSLCEKIIILN